MTSADQPHTTSSTKRNAAAPRQREKAERDRRLSALDELCEIVRDGALDVDILLDKRRYRGGPTV
ncbi:type II toxin-antitoxin system VapB family antitoxin [Streptomyces sp. SID14515]|uniref:type II toxin-antitoxin system VapB family antitoxin n=1 Tax=Streptomyces sp. SID14515 TaxID=2706074 RepID=UPI0013C7E9C7|nr:type II toxin-antitoxin system VapB family antitoxin [Streptomyces sp. SID14515]NEB42400.1 type II toxin-antitoxin system VapB family antitoxin [Streptomyces sp. SID14515]